MISVCIATYNGEKYIKEQLDSILVQLGKGDEVVISDDNSSDSTLDVIRSFSDKRIKIFINKRKGLIKNFENAIKKSSGDFIFLSDQDDIWERDKVEVCLVDFEKGYDLILSDCSIFESESKEVIHDSFFKFNNSKMGVVTNVIKNNYIGCCMAFNRKVKNTVLPFPDNIPMHDSWIGIIAEMYFVVNFNNRKLIKYRKHSQNASQTSAGISTYSIKQKISFRFFLVKAIIYKIFKF